MKPDEKLTLSFERLNNLMIDVEHKINLFDLEYQRQLLIEIDFGTYLLIDSSYSDNKYKVTEITMEED